MLRQGSGWGERLLRVATRAPLVALTPLLALSDSVIIAAVAGALQLLLVLPMLALRPLANAMPSSTQRWLLQGFVLACLVASAELVLRASNYRLVDELGIYLPLLACSSLAWLVFASDDAGTARARDLLADAIVFVGLALLLGALREFLGSGTLFAGGDIFASPAEQNLASGAVNEPVAAFTPANPLLRLALTPAGGLLLLGLLMAALQRLAARFSNSPDDFTAERAARRVRVTGKPDEA